MRLIMGKPPFKPGDHTLMKPPETEGSAQERLGRENGVGAKKDESFSSKSRIK